MNTKSHKLAGMRQRQDRIGIALEAALRRLELEAMISGLIGEARERLAQGTYGLCVGCREKIAGERLRAVPWARLCATCQDAADHLNASA